MARQKLHFLYRDDEHMTISSLAAKVQKYTFLPGAIISTGLVFWKEDRKTNAYMTVSVWDKGISSGKKFLNEDFTQNYFRSSRRYREEYGQFIQETRKLETKNLSTQELIKTLSKLWDFEFKGIAFFWGSQAEPLSPAENLLRKILSVNFPKEKVEEIIAVLLVPEEFDKIQQAEIDWAKIVFSKTLFTKKDFWEYGLRYPFLFRNSHNLEESFNYLKHRFKQDKKRQNGLKKEIRCLKVRKMLTVRKQKKLVEKIKDKRIHYLLRLFHRHAIERMELKYTWAGVEEFLFYDLFIETAKRINEDYYKMISYYRIDDIIDCLKRKAKLSEKEIENRKKTSLFISSKSKEYFYSGKRAFEQAKKYYPELLSQEKVSELRGTIASPGKAKGKVMIIFTGDLNELAKLDRNFKKGQILVTGMTQPNMVSLIKKASAIVTDEGGLTSHAAIISREFNIPCIVGTHKATQVLKDGDLVEVDANKGIVRIFKK